MIEWAAIIAVILVAASLIAAYAEGRRSRGQTADARKDLYDMSYQALLDKLTDALDGANSTHIAAIMVVDDSRRVLDALRTPDPSTRHRMLLSQAATDSSAPSGRAARPEGDDASAQPAADLDLRE